MTTMELYHRLGEQAKQERGSADVWHEADIDGHHLYMADTSFGDGPIFRFDNHAWQIAYGDAPVTRDTGPEDLANAIKYGMRATWVSRFNDLNELPLSKLNEAVEAHRVATFNLLLAVVDEIEARGMAFQDDPWWPEFSALAAKLKGEQQ